MRFDWKRIAAPIAAATVLVFSLACASSKHSTSTTMSTDTGTETTTVSSNTTGMATTSTDANGTTYVNGQPVNTTTTPIPGGSTTTTTTDSGTVIRSTTTTTTTPATAGTTTTAAVTAASSTPGSTTVTTTPGSTTTTTTTTVTIPSQPVATAAGTTVIETPAPMTSSTVVGGGRYGYYHHHHGSRTAITLYAVNASFANGNAHDVIGGTTTTPALGADYRDANGAGLAITPTFGDHFAIDFAGAYIRPRVNFTPVGTGFTTITGGRLRMIPITAIAQWHFVPVGRFFDPYIGGGGAYVMMRNARGFAIGPNGVVETQLQNVHYRNQFGPAVQGGIRFSFRSFGLDVNAKYLPLDARGTASFGTLGGGTITGTRGTTKLNPLLLSAGISFGY